MRQRCSRDRTTAERLRGLGQQWIAGPAIRALPAIFGSSPMSVHDALSGNRRGIDINPRGAPNQAAEEQQKAEHAAHGCLWREIESRELTLAVTALVGQISSNAFASAGPIRRRERQSGCKYR